MLRKITLILTLVGVVGLVAAPAVSAAPPARGDVLTETIQDAQVTVDSLTRDPATNELLASITVTNVTTGASLSDLVVPAQVGSACDILSLDLGPLNLDILGLVVDLSEVNLDITAVPGPGNLLGNLLCAVAGLLDGPTGIQAILNQIAALLNQILGALG
jgi:hypothetical protein